MTDPVEQQLANDLLAASIHEIKNRFGLLFAQLEQLLQALPLDESHSHSADLIQDEAQYIGSELVRILASYKSLDSGASANLDQQFLLDFLEEKVARHASTARARGLQIDFECDEDLAAFFDAGIISIVLDTAIYNAAKEGAKTILITAEHEQGSGELTIQVHDNGPGFPPAMLDAAASGPGTIKAESGSTGLGLHFARRLLALHRDAGEGHSTRCGTLALGRSDRLGGACVSLHLPQ